MKADESNNRAIFRAVAALALASCFVACTAKKTPEPDMDESVAAGPTLGEALYQENCSACHEGKVPKAPHRDWLAKMAPDAVVRAMTEGSMARAAESLNDEEISAVTEFLTGIEPTSYVRPPGATQCDSLDSVFDLESPPVQIGWGYDSKRFAIEQEAGFSKADIGRLKLKWAFAFPGAVRARSLPVVAMGAVFVGSQDGTVYAFDLEQGCARWTTRVSAEVRTAVVIEPWAPGSRPERTPRAFFGDLMGRVHAVDATTGEFLWTVRADDHPNATITGTPVVHGDLIYVPVSSLEVLTAPDIAYECCTFRGSVVALNIDDGSIVWKHYTVPQPAVDQGLSKAGTRQWGPSGAAVWGSPAIDESRGLIYFGSSENYSSPADENSDAIFAVNLKTGERHWSKQLLANDAWNASCYFGAADHPNCPAERGPDYDFSASPMLVDDGEGGQVLIAGQKSGVVYGLDPDNRGDIIWSSQVGAGGVQGGVHFGMSAEGTRILVPITDIPIDAEGKPIEGDRFPGIHRVDAKTGRIVWRAVDPDNCDGRRYCDPGISAAATSIPGAVFAGHLDGSLRAYDTETGNILWQFDTAQEFEAVNGVASGGSIGGPGPTVGGGALIVNSGYDFGDHMPGNALLVFSVEGS